MATLKDYQFTTQILHSDRFRSPQYGSLHEPVHTSVAFGYDNAESLANVFQGKEQGFAYARQNSPTVKALEEKITLMEKGIDSVAFSTGMSAITHSLAALLNQGDHFISSQFLFGNTNSAFESFKRLGLEFDLVDSTDVENFTSKIKPNTKLIFTETIANPVTQIADLKRIGELCGHHKLLFVVDNTMTSPALFNPIAVGASLVINALTKYICGHGNALGGAITDTGAFNWSEYSNIMENYRKFPVEKWGITQIRKKGLRDLGGALSADNAHKIAVGSETLSLRMNKISDNALKIARFLDSHEKVEKVNYPGLENHPQHTLAKSLFKNFSGIMSFSLHEDLDVFKFLNKLRLIISSSNLGDNRTLAIPVAHTIFFEMGLEKRRKMNISENLIRFSVGIEEADDLIGDIDQALKSL